MCFFIHVSKRNIIKKFHKAANDYFNKIKMEKPKLSKKNKKPSVDQFLKMLKLLDIEDKLLCRICFDSERETVFMPCKHMVACVQCAERSIQVFNHCPICKQSVSSIIKVIKS